MPSSLRQSPTLAPVDTVDKTDDIAHIEETASVYDEKVKDVPAEGKLDYSGFAQKTDPKEIKLVRKLDLHIMTSLWAMYWLNYLDRNAIALAKISTIVQDLKLTDVEYQTAVSVRRLRPHRRPLQHAPHSNQGPLVPLRSDDDLGGSLNLHGLCKEFHRSSPHAVLPWCRRGAVLPRRDLYHLELLHPDGKYTGNILATAFAGLIAAGIFQLDGKLGFAGWQWLFIIQGSATGLVALAAYPFLPDTPLTTRWLTQEERQMAHDRLLRDKVDEGEKGSVFAGLRQAVSDPRVWLFCLAQNLHLSANGFKNFFPSVVKTLGFSQTITLVLTCPPYLIAGIFTLVVSLTSGKYNERTWHITACKAFAILGFALAPATLNTATRYVAMCIFTIGTYGVNSIILGWAATVCSQTVEKKAVTIAMMTSISNASFIYTPYLFSDSDKPRYTTAMAAMAAFSLLCALCAWAMRFILIKQNRTLAQTGAPTKYPY